MAATRVGSMAVQRADWMGSNWVRWTADCWGEGMAATRAVKMACYWEQHCWKETPKASMWAKMIQTAHR